MNLEGKLLQILTTFPEKYFLCHCLPSEILPSATFSKGRHDLLKPKSSKLVP